MLDARSRYRHARAYVSGEAGRPVFAGTRPRDIRTREGAIEHTLQKGERLDLLAREYYGDSRLWWQILDANPQLFFGGTATLDALAGSVILIPGNER